MKLLMMTKNVNVCLLSLFHIILLINIIFCYLVMHEKWSGLSNNNLKWVKKAAKEVGEVASMSCSGHGKAFLDGWVIDGEEQPVCECYACFTGPFCSHFSRPCIADADSGNPMFLEPFWTNEEETSGIIVPGWHRMSYTYPDERSMSIQLEKYVRKLHALVGNAITDGIHIVFGTGSTQLFNAAVHALSSKSTVVVASIPFYHLYKEQTDFFQSPFYNFKGDASLWKNRTEVEKNTTFVEFVTSPNNPDGELKDAVLQGPSVKTIYDRVYYWPFYTPISAPAVDDLMLFSISKLTGHAGSRFGWALVKDEFIYQKMMDYVTYNTLGVSQDTQLRMLKILKAIVDGGARDIFEFGQKVMSQRWFKLKEALSSSSYFSLQHLTPRYCTFYQRVREPSPAYAWLKCERENDTNCYEVLKAAGILGRKGKSYGAINRYVRLSLIKSEYDFNLLLDNIKLLVSFSKDKGIHI